MAPTLAPSGPHAPLVHVVERELTLCELLDRVLNKGVVLTGEIVISVAGIDLLYLSVGLVVSAIETLLAAMEAPNTGGQPHDALS